MSISARHFLSKQQARTIVMASSSPWQRGLFIPFKIVPNLKRGFIMEQNINCDNGFIKSFHAKDTGLTVPPMLKFRIFTLSCEKTIDRFRCCQFSERSCTGGGPISEWMIRCCGFLTVFINKFIVNQNYSKNILKLVK
jgi:hypothetical protein